MNLKPDSDLMRLLLILLDGTRDRAALVAEVASRIQAPPEEMAELTADLPQTIDNNLKDFASLGLLLA
jgi:cytochrome oxidase Cu insertion factor (SCO1/SenC/PrrC family)